MKKPESNSNLILSVIFIAAGLLIRIAGLFYNGMHNYDTYREWGMKMNQLGLADAFSGGYGPISYIIMGWCDRIAAFVPDFWWLPYKGANLIFEIAILLLLLQWFRRDRIKLLLIYWLNPWFIMIGSWTGFWDAAFVFFLLCSAVMLQKAVKGYHFLLSGLIFGVTFLIKPQIVAPASALFLYFILKYLIRFKFREVILFAIGFSFLPMIFNLYFFLFAKSAFYLFQIYFGFADYMPYLVNSEINIWHSVTRLIMYFQHMTGPIYSLKTTLYPYSLMEKVSYMIFALLLIFYVLKLVRNNSKETYFKLFTMPLILMPQILTRSHANHFFPATIFLLPLIMKMNSKMLFIGWTSSIFFHLYNVYSRFGLGRSINEPLYFIGEPVLTIFGVLQFGSTLLLVYSFFKMERIKTKK